MSSPFADELINIIAKLRVVVAHDDDPQIVDIMTNIRVITGVAIVRQTLPVVEIGEGRQVLYLSVKVMPSADGLHSLLEFLGKSIKAIDGVELVKFDTVDDTPVLRTSDEAYVF